MKKNDYQSSILMNMTSILRQEIEENGGSYEFMEPVNIEGRYGTRAATKYFFVNDGKLYAHVYSGWMMENAEACLECESGYMSESCLRQITGLVRRDCH